MTRHKNERLRNLNERKAHKTPVNEVGGNCLVTNGK